MKWQHPSHARRAGAPWPAMLVKACASILRLPFGAQPPFPHHHHGLTMPIRRIAEHHDPCQCHAHQRLAIAVGRRVSVASVVCEQRHSPCATENAGGALQLALHAAIAAAPVRMALDMAERSAFIGRLLPTTAPPCRTRPRPTSYRYVC